MLHYVLWGIKKISMKSTTGKMDHTKKFSNFKNLTLVITDTAMRSKAGMKKVMWGIKFISVRSTIRLG